MVVVLVKQPLLKCYAIKLAFNIVGDFSDWYYYDQKGRFDYDGGAVNFDHP